MKDYVIINQNSKNEGVNIISILVLLVFVVISIIASNVSLLLSFFFVCVGVFLVGFSDVYRINKDFNNENLYRFFGKVFWKTKLSLEFPEYISVFHASFVSRDDDGSEDRYKEWVIRFFNENRHFTILQHSDYNMVLEKANELGTLLDVPVYDRSKDQ
ncbi:hypothetical protein [Aquimarina pacifica]|uniref:hypothetical protein n=1 Tax=Aquimarina pacifica TaxID=1296415 RepID=UPI00046F0700|nr:hypothetical protein [Aquimarina pacifica]